MQKKVAARVNCSQEQQPQANGEKICMLQSDVVKEFDNTNAEVISRTTVTTRAGRAHKRHGKDMYQHTVDVHPVACRGTSKKGGTCGAWTALAQKTGTYCSNCQVFLFLSFVSPFFGRQEMLKKC